jgi:hypothetical protein
MDVLLFALVHPRWEFVFQPIYAAYLNLLEPWWKVGGCEFSRSSNPLYYMRKLDFPARVAQTSHEVMSG